MEQHMVQCLAASLGRGHAHAEILTCRLLADEFVKALRAKSLVRILGSALGRGDAGGIGGHAQTLWQLASPGAIGHRSEREGTRGMLIDRRTMVAGSAAVGGASAL